MKIVLQRVKSASVKVEGKIVGEIGKGFLLLVGIGPDDDANSLSWMAKKIANLRIFEDDDGKMNLDLKEVDGDILAVSQFTLYADTKKGNRPSFGGSAPPEIAEAMFNRFVNMLREYGNQVETGVFGAHMDVDLVNWGPVTIILQN